MSPEDNGLEESDGETAVYTGNSFVKSLERHFAHHENFIFKQALSGSSVCHCPEGVPLSQEYRKLRSLLSQHAVLKLQKDIATRLIQFELFNKNLQKLVEKEILSWKAINRSLDAGLENYQTNLIALSSICDEFRMHLNHWMCIKQRVKNNRWLRPFMPNLLLEMKRIGLLFIGLQESALWWTEKLLKHGLQVFAYVDRGSLTWDDVFAIVRGIEEFNTLIQLIRMNTHEMKASCTRKNLSEKHQICLTLVRSSPLGSMNSYTTKPVPFLKLLRSLAQEFAKSATSLTKHFVDHNSVLINAMLSKKFRRYEDTTHRLSSSPSPPLLPTTSTSDYFSETPKAHDSSEEIVDLTCRASPLLDFGKKEREYIGKVIQIACQQTSLLRKNKPKGNTTENKPLAIVEEPSDNFSRNDNKRKSVSWGDSHDMSVCKQLTMKYDESLWNYYGVRLLDSLCYDIQWGKPATKASHLGCIDMFSSHAIKVFSSSLASAATKGFFTSLGTKQMLTVIDTIHARALVSCCDAILGKCLVSIETDKALPMPLSYGNKSSKTAFLLKSAVLFVRQQLQGSSDHTGDILLSAEATHKAGSNDLLHYEKVSTAIGQIRVITELTEKWCCFKTRQYLASYKMPQFLLVIHGDLMMMHKEIHKSVMMVKNEDFKPEIKHIMTKLEALLSYRADMMSQLEIKVAGLTKEIISESMCKRSWWQQTTQALGKTPAEAQQYIQKVTEQVLLPVLNGAQPISSERMLIVLQAVLHSVCEAWAHHYITNKIIFSWQGANHLNTDFLHVLDFLHSHFNDHAIKDKLSQLKPVIKFSAIIKILLDQPKTPSSQPSQARFSRNKVSPLIEDNTEQILTAEEISLWTKMKAVKPGKTSIIDCCTFKTWFR